MLTTSERASKSSLLTSVAPTSAARAAVRFLAPGDHVHLERAPIPGDARAQPAEPDHAERLAVEAEPRSSPASGPHGSRGLPLECGGRGRG